MKNITQKFEIKAHNDETGTFTAYANVFNIKDEANDVTMKGAFINTIAEHKAKQTMPKLLAQHGHTSMPIGVITDMEEDEKGLKISGKFALGTQAGKEAYELVVMKAIDSFSIGFVTVESKNDVFDGESVRALLELDVKEVSLVTFACNEDSKIESIKSALLNNSVTPKMVQGALQESGLTNRQAEKAMQQIKRIDLSTKESEMTQKEKVDTGEVVTETVETKTETKTIEEKAGYWMRECLQDPVISLKCLLEVISYLPPTTHAAMLEIAEVGRLEQLSALGYEVETVEETTKDMHDDNTEEKSSAETKETKLSLTDTQGWFKE